MSDAAKLAGEAALSRAFGRVTLRTPPQPSDARQGESSGSRGDEKEGSGDARRSPWLPELPDEVVERIIRHALGDDADRWSLGERFRRPPARGQPRPFRQPRGPLRLVCKRWRDTVDAMCEHVEVDRAVMVGDEALCGVIKAMHLKSQLDFMPAESNIETLTLVGSHTEGGELKLGTDGLREALRLLKDSLRSLTIRDTGMALGRILDFVEQTISDHDAVLKSLTIDGDSRQSRDRTAPFETSMCFPVENRASDMQHLNALLKIERGLEELHLTNLPCLFVYPQHPPPSIIRDPRIERQLFLNHAVFIGALQGSSLKSLTLDRVGLHDQAAERIVTALPPTIEAIKLTCQASLRPNREIPEYRWESEYQSQHNRALRNGEPDDYIDNCFTPRRGFQRTWPRLLCERLIKGDYPNLNDVTLPGEYIGATTALHLEEMLKSCAGASPPREFKVTFTTFDAEGIPTIPEAILGRWRVHKSKYVDASLESKELGSITISSMAPDIPGDSENDREPHPTSWSEKRLAVELAHHMAQREAFADGPLYRSDYDIPFKLLYSPVIGFPEEDILEAGALWKPFPKTSVYNKGTEECTYDDEGKAKLIYNPPDGQYLEWSAMRMWTALGHGAPRHAYAAAMRWLLTRPEDASLRKLAARAYLKDWVLIGAFGLVRQIKPDHCMPCGLWEAATAMCSDPDFEDKKIMQLPQFPVIQELLNTAYDLARMLEKRAAANVPNSDFVPDGVYITQAGLRKCSSDPELGRALKWRGYFWPGQDEHAFHRAVMCVLLKHWVTMVFEDEALHPGIIADQVIAEVEDALFTQLIAYDVVSDAINEHFSFHGMFSRKDEGSISHYKFIDEQGMAISEYEWVKAHYGPGRRWAHSPEGCMSHPIILLFDCLVSGCGWAMYDAIYRSLDYQRMRFEGTNTTLNYASFDRWTETLLRTEHAPVWIHSALNKPWPEMEAALRIAARVIAGVRNENDLRKPEIDSIALILDSAAKFYPKHPWRLDTFSHDGSSVSSSSEAIKELNDAVEAFFRRRKFAPLPRGTGAHGHQPLIRSWAEWLHAIGSPPPLTIDQARAKHDELAAGNSEYERLEAELASVHARMDKLGGVLRGVRSELRTSAAFHRAPATIYLREAAEGWGRFKQPHSSPGGRPRLRQAKLDPRRPWTLDGARRDSAGGGVAGRLKSLRRVPSPLTVDPEEMATLDELDLSAADALRRLFEHCDAAAAYVDDDLDGVDASNGAAGWSRVDDGHGFADRGVLGRGPDTVTLATYVHEWENGWDRDVWEGEDDWDDPRVRLTPRVSRGSRDTRREEVAERCDDGERGGGGAGSIPVESTARRSLGNVLRVLGASEASRWLVDGWLGLLDRARSARAARRRGEDVDFDVDDALAASVPQLYTGKDVRGVAHRRVGGALVRLVLAETVD